MDKITNRITQLKHDLVEWGRDTYGSKITFGQWALKVEPGGKGGTIKLSLPYTIVSEKSVITGSKNCSLVPEITYIYVGTMIA
jgi:hypothetical protein